MDILQIIVSSIVGLWLGSVEWRMRQMQQNINDVPNNKSMREFVELKQASLQAAQADLKDDLQRLENKIDKLIDLFLRSK